MSNNSPITLNLAESKYASEFFKTESNNKNEPINLIHINEYREVLDKIAQAIPYSEDELKKVNLHNAITILGARGSGKTSFLLTVRKAIENNVKLNHPHAKCSDLSILDMIDPTLIEEKGHVFLNVISTINASVEAQLTKNECDSNQKSKIILRHTWEKALSKLANGLPSIDGIGSNDTTRWEDAEFVMDNGLRALDAARNLSKNFNEYLSQSLQILDKKAFLLTFDDIDVDTSKGWAIMETIRKYLHSARIITILSGDLKLFTTALRQKKWENFGKEILKYEGTIHQKADGTNPQLDRLNDIVTELSAQYLLKIMQPGNRISLTTLQEKKMVNQHLVIHVKRNEQDSPIEINQAYQNIFQQYGIKNKTQAEVFKTFMLGLPFRLQVQFLTLMLDNTGQRNVAGSTIDIFTSYLYEKNIDINLVKGTYKYLAGIIMRLLIREKRLFDLYQLQPNTSDNSLNASLMSLSMLTSSAIQNKNKFLIFDYFIRIGYIRNLNPFLNYENEHNSNIEAEPTINDLCERSAIYNDNVLRDVAGHIQGYLYGAIEKTGNVKSITHSFSVLYGLGAKDKGKNKEKSRLDEAFSINNRIGDPVKNHIGLIPALTLYYNHKAETRLCYSVYVLIAAIGELVKRYETVAINENEESNIKHLLRGALRELSQLRSYPINYFSNKNLETGLDSNFDYPKVNDPSNTKQLDSIDNFIDHIYNWLKVGHGLANFVIAPYILGKISTRFYIAMDNIQNYQSYNTTLGQIFSLQVAAFMNAVLIEDIRENISTSISININNIGSTNSVLVNNINACLTKKDLKGKENASSETDYLANLAFSRWMLACPLLWPFITQNELLEPLKLYCNGFFLEGLESISVIAELNNVEILGIAPPLPTIRAIMEYPKLNITLEEAQKIRGKHNSIYNLLKNKYPFAWFDENDPNKILANKNIRKHLGVLFGVTPIAFRRNTRNFRKHLKDNNLRW